MSEHLVGIHCPLLDGQFMSDGNCALATDGELVFAVAEERVSRRKYDGDFRAGLAYLLERRGIAPSRIAAVAISTFGLECPPTEAEAEAVRTAVSSALPGFAGELHILDSHHEAHALAALSLSGAKDALIGVIDNEGSLLAPRSSPVVGFNAVERTSYYLYRGGALGLVARDHSGPGSVGYGKAYSKMTRYLGFGSYHASGKTMGLAAFGDATRLAGLTLFERSDRPETEMGNSADGVRDVTDWFARQGHPVPAPRGDRHVRRIDADLAAWIQAELQASVKHRLLGLCAHHRPQEVMMCGGVALNSVMNADLRASLGVGDLFVPPSPGDAGLSIGALAWLVRKRHGEVPAWAPRIALGGRYDDTEIRGAIESSGGIEAERCGDPAARAAEAIAKKRIIGWFQGASEFGPRSLGQRSILASPSPPWSHVILNGGVKHREWFRPFAPALPIEDAARFFEDDRGSPFMMHISRLRPSAIAAMPAISHVDGTARLQTVAVDASPGFHRLLRELGLGTGLPVAVNTSFNNDGEPIVESPGDAIRSFLTMDWMDELYLDDWHIRRAS